MNIEQVSKSGIPRHVAVIMDGNGRWAQKHGSERILGHRQGVNSVRSIVEGAGELGIEYLTLYAFSTENWDRPKEEVSALMVLLIDAIVQEIDNLNEKNVRMLVIGDLCCFPKEVENKLREAIQTTSKNTGLNLILGLSYSGRWDILEAVRKISLEVKSGQIEVSDVNEQFFVDHLSTSGIPDPELLIRTSGEFRISNFLLWQIAYSEFYFSNILWPDFRKENLFEAIVDFQNRERRFGKTSEQIRN
jgi:undecaprenyl diphosphate synthase